MPETPQRNVIVSGSFDDIRSQTIRFLEEASHLGDLTVLLLPDQAIQAQHGEAPKFPLEERLYILSAIRYVSQVIVAPACGDQDELPLAAMPPHACWAVLETESNPRKQAYCRSIGIDYQVIHQADLRGFPPVAIDDLGKDPPRPKVVVTGCYDWFHSGHVRFFEEVAELGQLYVIVGNDINVRFLKGEGHPFFPQDERRYMVQSIRYVHQCLITSGMGWMDAEPEIALVKPELYAVNEDGDKPEKHAFCQEHGIRYVVLKRKPKPGLPRRQSTDLRGF